MFGLTVIGPGGGTPIRGFLAIMRVRRDAERFGSPRDGSIKADDIASTKAIGGNREASGSIGKAECGCAWGRGKIAFIRVDSWPASPRSPRWRHPCPGCEA